MQLLTCVRQDTCSTLVTLHLLDSRPLNDTLTTFLLQRSKTLQAILNWKSDSNDKEDVTPAPGGRISPTLAAPAREVTQVMKNALITIAQTLVTSRAILDHEEDAPSLLFRVLQAIQADSEDIASYSKLPIEFQLSTQSLLGQLMSSANFQLLPPDLRSYRPYIDLSSSSTSLTRSVFVRKLQEWFHSSCERWKSSSKNWLTYLHSVKEVWVLRTSIERFIMNSGLKDEEKGFLFSNMDILYQDRIIDIWKKALSFAEHEFSQQLRLQTFVAADPGTHKGESRCILYQAGLYSDVKR